MSRRGPVEIAVVGMACRFPGAPDLFAFWEQALAQGELEKTRVAVDEVPPGGLVHATVKASIRDAGLDEEVINGREIVFLIGGRDDSLYGHLAQDQRSASLKETLGLLESLHPEWSEADREAVRLDLESSLHLGPATPFSRASHFDDAPSAIHGAVGLLAEGGAEIAVAVGADIRIEGSVGALVLKRRADAERDGDRIYGLIRGLGRDLAMARAIRRAYRGSKIDPATVGVAEGIGLRALAATFPPVERGRRSYVRSSGAIGPAGMAGLIATLLSLHHRIVPPTRPGSWNERFSSRFTRNLRARPWIHGDPATPRRAGVNLSVAGGIKAHLVLEEHPPSAGGHGAMPGWDSEAILLSASDRAGLMGRTRDLLHWLKARPDAVLKDVAFSINTEDMGQAARIGLVATSLEDLAGKLETALAKLEKPDCRSIRDARGIYYWARAEGDRPKLAFLFPGEGSQYPGMLADLCPHFPEVRSLFDTSDRIAREAGAATWPSEHLFGEASGDLWAADLAVNVVLSSQWALYQLLIGLKIRPDGVVGHSSGELLAMAAAGVVAVDRAFEDQLGELGSIVGDLETTGSLPTARLVAVASDRAKVKDVIALSGETVDLAMDNCPHQVVLAGMPGAVEAVVARLRARGMLCEELPFARAYHTPSFTPAMGPLDRFFERLTLSPPDLPIYSCSTERRMPTDPESIRHVAVGQWTRAVRFRGTIEAMYTDGFTDFVDVGARGNLSGFVEDTLRGRAAFSVAANLPKRSGLTQLNHLVASLHARGVKLDPSLLYSRRRPTRIDWQAVGRPARPASSLPAMKLSDAVIARLRGREPIPGQAPVDFQRTMDAFLETHRAVLDAYQSVKATAEPSWTSPGPLAGEPVSIVPGRSAVSHVTLDANVDPVAEHHTLGGRRISAVHHEWRGLPVLPFSVMVEMLAEAASRLVPGATLVGLRDVVAHKWIRYESGPVALELHARIDPANPLEVAVSIFNRGLLENLRPLENAVFEGVVRFGMTRPEPFEPQPFSLESSVPCRFTSESIYAEQWLFHGPALQAVVGIGPVAMGGVEGTLRVLPRGPLLRDPAHATELLTDPIVLDNFTHLLGGWGLDRLADDGDVIFPLRMGELSIFGDAPVDGTDVSCRISIRELERHRVKVDADIVRPDGRTWMAIRGWEDWRFRWPGRYRDAFRQPDRTFVGEALATSSDPAGVQAVWLEPPNDMGRPVWRDVLEHVQMGPDERSAYLAMPGPDFRRTHRLWGRIAAKEAARRLWFSDGEAPTYPADLIIDRDPLGRPSLRSRLEPDRPMPAISIGHVDGVAVAMASSTHRNIGIDVEPIVERSSSFEATAFTPGERALLGSKPGRERAEWTARLWTAKEATAKATGLGFVDGPSGVEIVAVEPDGSMAAKLRGALATACPALANRAIRVVSARRGDHVWSWTLGERIDR